MKAVFLSRWVLVGCLLLAGSGCVESPAAWLPDSSGFLFVRTEKSGRQTVHHYDLAKKAQRQVSVLDGEIASDLAIHPKGESFALITRGEKGHALTILNLAGAKQHSSEILNFKPHRPIGITLHWFPTGDRLWLGHEHGHAWYDWRKKTLEIKEGEVACPAFLGSPFRPDGSGYVIHHRTAGYSLLDLEGWERRLKGHLDLWAGMKDPGNIVPRMEWHKHLMKVKVPGGPGLVVDTDKGTSSPGELDPRIAKAFDLSGKGPTLVDLVPLAGEEVALAILKKEPRKSSFQVVSHRFGENKQKTLIAATEGALLLPSPDRKHALVYNEKADGERALLVVGQDGEVLDEVSLGQRPAKHSTMARIIRAQAPDEEPEKPRPAVKTEALHYEVAIESIVVKSTKANGKAWDAFAGYPDIQVALRHLKSASSVTTPVAADRLMHTYNLLAGKVAPGDALELDVWDVDVAYNDHIGLKRLELTREMLEAGSVELTFGQVSSLRLKFFPIRSGASLKVEPTPEERGFEDGRIATRFEQLSPSMEGLDRAVRTSGKDRALVLLHGLRAHVLDGSRAYRPYFDSWQAPHSTLVRALVELGDVYGFSYGQNGCLDEVSGHADLAKGMARLKGMGYKEIVLVGHSVGGVIARQFVEDHPKAGVTQVVQVCSPNTGACLAHVGFVVREKQAAFLESITPQARMVSTARRDKRVPEQVRFTCLVGTYGTWGDCALTCYSQWPADLQEQGVAAYPVRVNHHTCMETDCVARKLAEVIASPAERWRPDEVAGMRRVLFD